MNTKNESGGFDAQTQTTDSGTVPSHTPDSDLEKLKLAATFVALTTSQGFRKILHDLATGKQSKQIEIDLANHEGLNSFLCAARKTLLEPHERKDCADWGIRAAQSVKHMPSPEQRDREIARRLSKHLEYDGSEPPEDGFQPIGA